MRGNRAELILGSAMGVALLLSCAKGDAGAGGATPAPSVPMPTAAPTAAPTSSPFQIGLQQAEALFDKTKMNHVAVVLVSSSGHVFPARLIVRAKRYRIVWIPDGEKLQIAFDNDALEVDCTSFAPMCVSKVSPQTATGSRPLKYSGTITSNGVSTPIDPHLEVVP